MRVKLLETEFQADFETFKINLVVCSVEYRQEYDPAGEK